MKKMILTSVVAFAAMTGVATAADLYTYSNGATICVDQDGYLVNGSTAWGTGYWYSEVEEAHGLKGVSKTHKFVSSC